MYIIIWNFSIWNVSILDHFTLSVRPIAIFSVVWVTMLFCMQTGPLLNIRFLTLHFSSTLSMLCYLIKNGNNKGSGNDMTRDSIVPHPCKTSWRDGTLVKAFALHTVNFGSTLHIKESVPVMQEVSLEQSTKWPNQTKHTLKHCHWFPDTNITLAFKKNINKSLHCKKLLSNNKTNLD